MTADRVRRGELEAAVVLLPIDDERLEVRPIVRDEVLYVSAAPERARRAGDDRAARVGAADVLRRRVRRGRTRSAASSPSAPRPTACGCGPRVEVERSSIALRLVARGIGDTYLPSALHTCAGTSRRPAHRPLQPGALRHVRHHHSPARLASRPARELLADLETHMRAVADELD